MQAIEIMRGRSSTVVFFDGTRCHDELKRSITVINSSYNCFTGSRELGGTMFTHQSRKGIRNRGRKVKTLRNHRGD